jgi:hypothetical protein
MCERWSLRPSITVSGVAISERRVVTGVLAASIALISSSAPGRRSGRATRRIEGFKLSDASDNGPRFRDSISAESDGVYDEMYRSEKYSSLSSADGNGPIAWRGREQKAPSGTTRHEISPEPSTCEVSRRPGFPTSSYRSERTEARVRS